MTLAIDHTPPASVTSRVARLVRAFRAVRARVAAFHHYWFDACDEPSDPFASMSARDRWDLPVFHPAEPED